MIHGHDIRPMPIASKISPHSDNQYKPPVSIVIRSRNNLAGLKALMERLKAQDYSGPIEYIVVDTESTDGTPEYARSVGAKIVSFPQSEFTYPRSMNLGVAAATGEVVILTVEHAIPTNSRTWIADGVRHFEDSKVAGVWSPVIPLTNCTPTEVVAHWPIYLFARLQGVKESRKASMGVMGATNCALRRSLWGTHPFDESYEQGGEDTAWAAWALQHGYKIMCDPAFTIRHSHGTKFWGMMKQIKVWRSMARPQQFSLDKISFRNKNRT